MAVIKGQIQNRVDESLAPQVVEKLLFDRKVPDSTIWDSGIRTKRDLSYAILQKYPECKPATCSKRVSIIWPKIKAVIDGRMKTSVPGVYAAVSRNECIAYVHADSRESAQNILQTLLSCAAPDLEIRLENPSGDRFDANDLNKRVKKLHDSRRIAVQEQIESLTSKAQFHEFLNSVCDSLERTTVLPDI